MRNDCFVSEVEEALSQVDGFTNAEAVEKAEIEPISPQVQAKQTRASLEIAIRRVLREHLDDLNGVRWIVASGKQAASDKVLNVVELLEDALTKMDEDDTTLVKTMRVARNALLHIGDDVQRREFACLMNCTCIAGGCGHLPWPSYAAGCHSKTSDDQSRIGGRLWDVAELLRLHHGYERPRPVAQSVIYALKQLADELRFKEDWLAEEIAKISKAVEQCPKPENDGK